MSDRPKVARAAYGVLCAAKMTAGLGQRTFKNHHLL